MGDTDNTNTQPIEIPPKPSRLIRILDEAEMTDREIRYASVVATGTLRGQLEAHRILYPDAYMKEPTPYSHNLSVWQKRLLHIGLVAATIPVLGIVVALIVFTHYNSVAVTSGVVVTLIVIGGYILLYHLIEWQWRETRVTCTADALAYKRSAHPFLNIDELDLRTPTSGLTLKHKGRPWLARVLRINSWTLRFESSAQEDEFLRTRFKYIVDGDVLVETITDFVRYNSRKIG